MVQCFDFNLGLFYRYSVFTLTVNIVVVKQDVHFLVHVLLELCEIVKLPSFIFLNSLINSLSRVFLRNIRTTLIKNGIIIL